jgi:hypothetical protein
MKGYPNPKPLNFFLLHKDGDLNTLQSSVKTKRAKTEQNLTKNHRLGEKKCKLQGGGRFLIVLLLLFLLLLLLSIKSFRTELTHSARRKRHSMLQPTCIGELVAHSDAVNSLVHLGGPGGGQLVSCSADKVLAL